MLALFGLIMAALAIASVVCTAVIYASLRPVPPWHTRLAPACFLAITAMTGVLLLVLPERWLFFAEARHISSAWFGARR